MAPTPNPTNSKSPDSNSSDTEAERIVFECLEAPDLDRALEALKRDRPELEERVVAALKALQSDGLLDEAEEDLSDRVPERLGPFRLIRRLGAGGMGIVYLAEQEDLGRQVALKLIRPEQLFFPGSRERFRREVEAVARLQHAGIVSVFTVGEEDGLPFFSMEFVDGRSLSQMLRSIEKKSPSDLCGADFAAALRTEDEQSNSSSRSSSRRVIFDRTWTEVCVDLVIQIADALQHAHERGVLHRDVKPSNILITTDGRARLVDFGLARTEGAQQLTATSTQIGSLPYLPPEQLDEQTSIPSVRQDVYSLGVTLYEMLAVKSPFLGATSEETRRNILDGKPPSLRQRNAAVSWDLETVCLTAMDPDPAQRYASIADLLTDLENVRHRRPIEAKRPSPWIRLRRWEQRHPTATAVGGVAIALIAVAAVLFALFESSARRESERLTKKAERKATEAAEVTDFLVDLFQYASPEKSLGEDLPVRLLLQQGADRIDRELKGQPEVSARLLSTFGRVYSWLKEPSKSAGFYERAADSLADVRGPEDFDVLFYRLQAADEKVSLGKYDEAADTITAVHGRIGGRLAPGHYLNLETLRVEASLLDVQGKSKDAERIHRQIVAEYRKQADRPRHFATALRNLAIFLKGENRHEEAQRVFDECLELQRRAYPKGHPSPIFSMHPAAHNLASLGRFDEARELAQAAVAEAERIFGAEHPKVANVLNSAAVVHREAGDIDKAIEAMQRVHRIVREFRDVSKNYYARSLNDLAINYHDVGKYGEARKLLEQALTASREAFSGDHILTAFLLQNLGNTLGEIGDVSSAEKHCRAGTEMLLRLDPDSRYVARSLNSLAWVLLRSGTAEGLAEAGRLAEDSIRAAAKWSTERWALGRAHAIRALLGNRAGDGKRAEPDARRALELYDTVRRADHPGKAIVLYNLAWALLQQKGVAAAEPFFRQSIEMYGRMGQDYPEKAYPLNHYGFALLSDRPADALPLLEEALAIRRRTLPKHARWRVITTLNLAVALRNLKEYEKAEPLLLEAHDAVLATAGNTSPAAIASARRLVALYEEWGRPKRAEKYRSLAARSGK